MTDNLTGNWNYPTAMRFGAGRISELGALCRELSIEKPLLVTDPGLASLPMVQDLGFDVFSDIKPNPVGQNVGDGVRAFNAGGHDGVIAFGGGSGLDAGKAIALMAGQTCSLWDLEDVGDNWTRADASQIAPCIAVPTTAGTGSEVGRSSVITDEDTHLKKIIFHPGMTPDIVLADPELTVGLPPHLTAATGMDALSHCLEAFCVDGFHPMADGIAVEGMRRVKEWLTIAYHEPQNIEARANMLIASSMGATAFQKGLGGMHALAHPLGGLYDAHHGLLNAILMPYVLEENKAEIEDKMIYLARAIGLKKHSFDSVLDWVLELRAEQKIPHSLREIDIDEEQAELIAKRAAVDPSAGGNPKPLTPEILERVFRKAVQG